MSVQNNFFPSFQSQMDTHINLLGGTNIVMLAIIMSNVNICKGVTFADCSCQAAKCW